MDDSVTPFDETLRPAWETIEARARTLNARPSSTLARQVDPDAARRWKNLLTDHRRERFDTKETLGEGGMGVVRRGTQHSLRRDVAVKSIRSGDDDVAITRVLQEALITGMLEHPNIVPVYDVDVDERGVPVILLKRIEGVEWAALIGNDERVRTEFEATDPLEWHLRVLMQVCNAVEHAHERRILHLDIKPSNVMIGEHGEVYLLDWGIALSLHDDESGRLPLVSQCRDIVGTPSYMAPEMLEADGARLCETTDVFLLGATLFELTRGVPPHAADSLMSTLHAALTRDVDPGNEVAPELAQVIRRATARDPAQRYATAADLRRAVRGFLAHRDSARLAERTDARLEDLLAALRSAGAKDSATPDEASSDAGEVASERAIDDAYAACRFGYGAALEGWPDNEPAKAGLVAAVSAMIEHELDRGRPVAAKALLRDSPNLDDALVRRVDAAVRDEAGGVEELQRLQQEHDPRIGQRTRGFLTMVMGVLWTVVPVFAWFQGPRADLVSYSELAAVTVGFIVIGGALAFWARESMSKTRVNRQFWGSLMSMCGAQLVLIAGAAWMELPYEVTNTMIFFMWACVAVLAAIAIEIRTWPLILVYFGAFFASIAWPHQTHGLLALANFAFLVNVGWIWRLPLRRTQDEIDRAKAYLQPARAPDSAA